MKRYDSYKDSGIDWIGEVPVHWKNTKIKYLAKEKGSLFIDGDWIESKVITEDGIRYITTGNIKDGYYSEQGSGFISEETFKELNCTEVFEGDLLISRLNTPIGRACIIPNLGARIVTSVDNVILRPDEGIHKAFLLYLFSSKKYFENTELIARGATMQRISRGLYGNIKISLPKYDEQKEIAIFLNKMTSTIDDLIKNKKQLISLLIEERIAIINHAITKGINSKAKLKDSSIEWIGEIPEHWKLKKLKYLCKLIINKAPVKPSYIIALENIVSWRGEIIGNPFENSMEGEVCLFKKGDVLFSKLRPYLAKVLKAEVDGGSVGELLVLRANENIIPDFLFFRMISEAIISIVDNSTYGTKMPRASWEKFISLIQIPLPSINEQVEIVKYVKDKIANIDIIVSKTEKEINLLQEYKTALISEAVTGKIDVRDAILN